MDDHTRYETVKSRLRAMARLFRTTHYPASATHYFYVASPRIRLALAANLDLTLVVCMP